MPNTQVLAALLAFRVSYLLIPFFLSIFVVIAFEKNRLKETLHHGEAHQPNADRKHQSVR